MGNCSSDGEKGQVEASGENKGTVELLAELCNL